MSKTKTIIIEQLQHLQRLMHRTAFHGFIRGGRVHNSYRGQGRILAILKLKPKISQHKLTYLLGMSKQSVSQLLEKLEKSGYISRKPSEDDKRVMNIKLTEAGMKVAVNMDDDTPETVKILDCLDNEELSTFSNFLKRIIKKCEEQFPDDDFDRRHKAMKELVEEFMSRHSHHFGGHNDECGGFHKYFDFFNKKRNFNDRRN